MNRPPYLTSHWSVAALTVGLALALSGCDDEKKGGAPQDRATLEQEKQQQLEALLKENGVDPTTLPKNEPTAAPPEAPPPSSAESAARSPKKTPPNGASPAVGATTAEAPRPDGISIKMLSTGTGPKTALRYGFQAGRTRKFQLDIEVGVERAIDGKPAPGVPGLSLAVSGTNKTLSVENGVAKREATFTKLVPTISGVPPEMLAQIQQQYAPLRGIQLIETVDPRGSVLGVNFDQRAIQPQILALMQQLQDGMTNAYLSLPKEAVGPGARWIASTEMGAAGITLLQQTEVRLVSLTGSKGEFEMTLSQKAKDTKVVGADLPPGVEMEVSKVEGTGSGAMSVDFAELLVSSKINLSTETAVKITEAGAPAPVVQTSTTQVKAQVSLTK